MNKFLINVYQEFAEKRIPEIEKRIKQIFQLYPEIESIKLVLDYSTFYERFIMAVSDETPTHLQEEKRFRTCSEVRKYFINLQEFVQRYLDFKELDGVRFYRKDFE